jgi:hypothetical protein
MKVGWKEQNWVQAVRTNSHDGDDKQMATASRSPPGGVINNCVDL